MKNRNSVKVRYIKGDFAVVPNVGALQILSPQAQALFVQICVYADNFGQCFPSRKTLALGIGLKKPCSIDKYIKELEDMDFIKIEKRKDDTGENLTNIYNIITRSVIE